MCAIISFHGVGVCGLSGRERDRENKAGNGARDGGCVALRACRVPLARMVGGLAPTHGVAADEGKGVERVQPTGVGPEPKGFDVAREARNGGRPGHLTHTKTNQSTLS